MNVTEAQAFNNLLSALDGSTAVDGIEAATYLANRAHAALGAGVDGPAGALVAEQAITQLGNEPVKASRPAVCETPDTISAFERQVAAAIARRCDGDGLTVDGVDEPEWAADRPDEDDINDELIVTHPSGRQVVVRIAAQLVHGALS